MDIDKLIFALEETISYLRNSRPSTSSQMSVEEIIRRLKAEATKAKNAKVVDVNFFDRLFAPNGILQDISIDNGGGTKFLQISQVIDEFIAGK